MRFRKISLIVSLCVIAISIGVLAVFRLKPGIDFTGGTELRVQTLVEIDQLSALRESYPDLQIVPLDDGEVLLKLQPRTQEEQSELILKAQEIDDSVRVLTSQTIGPIAGRELLVRAITAAVLAAIGILFLIGLRFSELNFGLSAVFALLHDVVIMIGVFSVLGVVFGVEVDVLFVTAVLTILSLSVHDTIVVFDRVRELKKNSVGIGVVEVVNSALTQTITRSINNSLTMIFMLTAMLVLGGESLRWFVLALLIGTVVGTYSSIFVAPPAYVMLDEFRKRRALRKKKR